MATTTTLLVKKKFTQKQLLAYTAKLAGCAKCHKVKGSLPQVDANGLYLHSDDPPVKSCPYDPPDEKKNQTGTDLNSVIV